MKSTIFLLVMAAFMSCDNSLNSAKTPADSSNAGNTTTPPSPNSNSGNDVSNNPDAKLVYDLTESMYAGIALMKEGEKKGTNPAFRQLATRLVTEHSALTKELEDLSAKKNWTLPPGEPDADRQKREAMVKESVEQFQKDWLQSLRERHETNIAKLENAQPSDADVKAAGDKGLPKIKELLGEIKAMQDMMK